MTRSTRRVRPRLRHRISSRVRALALALIGGGLASACTHEAGLWSKPVAAPTHQSGGVTLVALGQVGSGYAATRLAKRLRRTLEQEYALNRTPVLLWVGGFGATRHPGGRCRWSASNESPRGTREVAEVIEEHAQRGGTAFALPTADDRRCARELAALPVTKTRWRSFVLRIASLGRPQVVSSCRGQPTACSIEAGAPDGAIELVVLDTSAWAVQTRRSRIVPIDENDQQAAALLAAIERAPAVPRILVLATAIEAAGPAGLGGRWSTASFHHLPPALQQAIASGSFVGVVAGGDAAVQFVDDLSPAIRRSARTWIETPLFQVVATGTTYSKGSPRRLLDRIPQRRGITVTPQLVAEGPGFAQLRISDDLVHVRLHDHSHRRWRVADAEVVLARPSHAHEGPVPPMEPCFRCAPRAIAPAKTTAPSPLTEAGQTDRP